MGLSERPPPGPHIESVANRESEDVDGTCYRHVNHNSDNLDNDSEDLDNKAFNPKDNSSPVTESINNMKRTSTRKPSESSVLISSKFLPQTTESKTNVKVCKNSSLSFHNGLTT